MAAIKQVVFRGEFLRSDPEILLPEQAQSARNCILDSGKLKAMPELSQVYALPDASRLMIYLYDWVGAAANNWLSWIVRVCVQKSPVSLETYNRIYWTDEGLPQMKFTLTSAQVTATNLQLGTSLVAGEQSAVYLGVPEPAAAVTLAVSTKTTTTWKRRWQWWSEDSDGNRYNINQSSMRYAALQWTAGSGTEHYFTKNPGRKPIAIYANGTALTELADNAMGGSMAVDTWTWDTTNNRVYVRITPVLGVGDPDSEAADWITGEWDFMAEVSATGAYVGSGWLQVKELVVGDDYELLNSNVPYMDFGEMESVDADFILWFEAHDDNVETGATIGRVYPKQSNWSSQNDAWVGGAKLDLEYRPLQVLSTGAYPLKIVYDVSSELSDYIVDRAYVYTLVTQCGEEGPPSPVSDIIGVMPNQDVVVSGLPTTVTAQTAGYNKMTKWRLYRTVTSDIGTAYQYVDEVSLSATTTYTDSIEDDEVGETIPSEGWLKPPEDLSGLIALPDGSFAGFAGRTVYRSESNQPHAWVRAYAVTVDSDIVTLGVQGNVIVVITTDYPRYITTPAPNTSTVSVSPDNQAGLAPCISAGGAVFYPSQDGLCMVNGYTVTVITDPFMLKQDLDRTAWSDREPENCLVSVHDGWVFCFTTGGSFAMRIADPITGMVEFDDEPQGIYLRPQDDAMYLIVGANIKKWRGSTTEKKTLSYRSKIHVAPAPIDFRAIRLTADEYPVNVKLYGDGNVLLDIDITDGEARLIPKVRRSFNWEYLITGTSNIQDFGLAQSMMELKQ